MHCTREEGGGARGRASWHGVCVQGRTPFLRLPADASAACLPAPALDGCAQLAPGGSVSAASQAALRPLAVPRIAWPPREARVPRPAPPAGAGVPCRRGPPPQDLAHAARRVAVQHAGQDWGQLAAQVGTERAGRRRRRGEGQAQQPARARRWRPPGLAAPTAAAGPCPLPLLPAARCSARGQMYSQLLPDILASRIPRTADGKPFPVAGAWGPGGEKRGACRAACSGACRSSPGLGGLACRCAWRAFLLGMHAAQGWHLHLILAFNDGHKPPPRTAPPPTGASLDIHPAAHHHHRLGPALPQGAVEGAGRDPGVPPAGCPAWGWGVCVCMGGGRGGACVGGWVCEGGGTHGQERATKLCRALEAAFPLPPCYPTALPRAQRRRLLIRHRLTRHAVPGTDAAAVHAPALFHPAGCTWREGQPGGIPALRFAASTNHRLSGVPPCCRRAPATA
jgi:hypothetical protein